jgi:hypothetical protein
VSSVASTDGEAHPAQGLRDLLIGPVGVEPAKVLGADLDDVGRGDQMLDARARPLGVAERVGPHTGS